MSSRDTERPVYRPGPWARLGGYTLLTLGALAVLVPIGLSVVVSLTSRGQFARAGSVALPDPVTLDNYRELLGRGDFLQSIVITAVMVATIIVVQVTSSVLAAYAFARLRFPGRNVLFALTLATMMIPGVVTMVPLYIMLTAAGLRATFAGLVLPFLLISPYAVFLLRQHFLSIPADLLHAAHLDGAGHLRTLWSIVVPISRPIILTLAIVTAVSHWNSFLWPLMIGGNGRLQVLTVATANLQTQFNNHWTLVTAATTLSILPLVALYLVFQRQIVGSLAIRGYN